MKREREALGVKKVIPFTPVKMSFVLTAVIVPTIQFGFLQFKSTLLIYNLHIIKYTLLSVLSSKF